MQTVNTSHLICAAEYLGTRILHRNEGKQALVLSDNSFIDKLQLHELNRDIDAGWVQAMKNEILKNVLSGEAMTLTVVIDVREVQRYISCDINGEDGEIGDEPDFKAFIVDGQHRWMAMKELVVEMPSISFPIYIMVYIVEDDDELTMRLNILNKRKEFTSDDSAVVELKRRFIAVLIRAAGTEHRRRHCVRNAVKGFEGWMFKQKKKGLSVTQLKSKLTEHYMDTTFRKISSEYEGFWEDQKIASPKLVTRMLGKVVMASKLYQLSDESHAWMNKL